MNQNNNRVVVGCPQCANILQRVDNIEIMYKDRCDYLEKENDRYMLMNLDLMNKIRILYRELEEKNGLV